MPAGVIAPTVAYRSAPQLLCNEGNGQNAFSLRKAFFHSVKKQTKQKHVGLFKKLTLFRLWLALIRRRSTNRPPPLWNYERKVDKCRTMVLLFRWRRRRRRILSHETSSLLRTEAHDMLTIWIIMPHLNSDVEKSNSWRTSLWLHTTELWRNGAFVFNKRPLQKWSNKGWEIHWSFSS